MRPTPETLESRLVLSSPELAPVIYEIRSTLVERLGGELQNKTETFITADPSWSDRIDFIAQPQRGTLDGYATASVEVEGNTLIVAQSLGMRYDHHGGGNPDFIHTANTAVEVYAYVLGPPGTPYEYYAEGSWARGDSSGSNAPRADRDVAGFTLPGAYYFWKGDGQYGPRRNLKSRSQTIQYEGQTYSLAVPYNKANIDSFWGSFSGNVNPFTTFASATADLRITVKNLTPDLAATDLAWDDQGGVTFSYDVRGSDLPRNATLGLYWAAGEQFEDILGPAIFSLPTERAVGGHGPIGVDRSILDLTPRPQGTTHLLLALDPPDADLPVGEIAELSELNNVLAIPVPVPDIEILVNSTETTADDITPVGQPIEALVVNTGGAGTITLHVEGPGPVSVTLVEMRDGTPRIARVIGPGPDDPGTDVLTIPLAAEGEPGSAALVRLIPSRVSNEALDIKLIARHEEDELAQAALTAVQVTFDPVRAGTTPDGMPDRIPPRKETSINVTVTPSDLKGQKVTLEILGSSPENGKASFGGKDEIEITGTGSVMLLGQEQTMPGHANKLFLVAYVRQDKEASGQDEETSGQDKKAGESAPFSVVAVPVKLILLSNQPATDRMYGNARYFGFYTFMKIDSDSGDVGDLEGMQIEEHLERDEETARGSLSGYRPTAAPPLTLDSTGFIRDEHTIREDLLPNREDLLHNPHNEVRVYQIWTFMDERASKKPTDYPIAESAFEISRSTFYNDVSGTLYLNTSKIPSKLPLTSIGGFSAQPGGGGAQRSSQEIRRLVPVGTPAPSPSPDNPPGSPDPSVPRLPSTPVREPIGDEVVSPRLLTGRTAVTNLRIGPGHPAPAEWLVLGNRPQRLRVHLTRPDFPLRVDLGPGRFAGTFLIDAPGSVLHLTGGTRRDRVRIVLTPRARDAQIRVDSDALPVLVRSPGARPRREALLADGRGRASLFDRPPVPVIPRSARLSSDAYERAGFTGRIPLRNVPLRASLRP